MKTIHGESLADGYPLCMPPEHWNYSVGGKRGFKANKDDSKVTCKKCKDILERMHKEIGDE